MTSVEPESTPAGGSLRLLRAATFAVCAVWLSSTAHVLGGGAAPSALLVGLLTLLVAAPVSLLAGRRRGPAAITVALLALQAGLHHVLGASAGAQSCSGMPAMPSMPAGHHAGMAHTMPAGAFDSSWAGASSMMSAPAMSGMSTSMLIWHAAAAAVLGLLLSLGERVLWQVVTWFVPQLTTAVPRLRVRVATTGRVIEWQASRRLVIRLLVGGLGRRGPPLVPGAPA